MYKILVSACLLGRPVRYDGRAKTLSHDILRGWQSEGRVVSFCPEVAAGLPTPRAPAEIVPTKGGDDVLLGTGAIRDSEGQDLTAAFRKGAELAVAIARRENCRFALLTDNSPSCGSTMIYSGNHDGEKRDGQGIVTAALRQDGVRVFSPDQIVQLGMQLDQSPQL